MLLHGFARGLGSAVNLAAHGFHVFSNSADGIAGGKAEGGRERHKGEFDIHGGREAESRILSSFRFLVNEADAFGKGVYRGWKCLRGVPGEIQS